MITIPIKALSINEAWQGRRYKTPAYLRYERDLLLLLPQRVIAQDKISIEINIGYSNKAADIDNFIKPFLDVLQKKYGFNDKNIYRLLVVKNIVKKGCEYISFSISEIGATHGTKPNTKT